ncbi:MAG: hypothetical protein H7832_02800 [Magnetococcus sp. DMHC-6]
MAGLQNNDRVGIVGGGPSGAMTAYFLLELASRIDLNIHVDIYESRDFTLTGPRGCNMCAGVISESLVQILAAEGINLPPEIVQRGIDSYILHTTGLEPVYIETPADDLRIATVFRGSGPRIPTTNQQWSSFDGFLLALACRAGAHLITEKVENISLEEGRPCIRTKSGHAQTYELFVGAMGVNSTLAPENLAQLLSTDFAPALSTKGHVSEVFLGAELTQQYLGSSMHVFLLDIPKLKFAALIPKVEYVTICLLGESIEKEMVARFMDSPEVRSCFPPDFDWRKKKCGTQCPEIACQCSPKLNIGPATKPYGNRLVLVGDAAVTRLYKDGIGAAYVSAKACAVTAIFLGVTEHDFAESYLPVCQRISKDNLIGKIIFYITIAYQKLFYLRRGMVTMVSDEKEMPSEFRVMSRVLWDTFTGSATYREIFLRTLTPRFFLRLFFSTIKGFWIRGVKWSER